MVLSEGTRVVGRWLNFGRFNPLSNALKRGHLSRSMAAEGMINPSCVVRGTLTSQEYPQIHHDGDYAVAQECMILFL